MHRKIETPPITPFSYEIETAYYTNLLKLGISIPNHIHLNEYDSIADYEYFFECLLNTRKTTNLTITITSVSKLILTSDFSETLQKIIAKGQNANLKICIDFYKIQMNSDEILRLVNTLENSSTKLMLGSNDFIELQKAQIFSDIEKNMACLLALELPAKSKMISSDLLEEMNAQIQKSFSIWSPSWDLKCKIYLSAIHAFFNPSNINDKKDPLLEYYEFQLKSLFEASSMFRSRSQKFQDLVKISDKLQSILHDLNLYLIKCENETKKQKSSKRI